MNRFKRSIVGFLKCEMFLHTFLDVKKQISGGLMLCFH